MELASPHIDGAASSERQGEISLSVAKRHSAQPGDSVPAQPLIDHSQGARMIVPGGLLAIGQITDQHTGDVVEQSCQTEVSQVAVDAVRALADILECEHAAGKIGAIRRADKMRQETQIASCEGTFHALDRVVRPDRRKRHRQATKRPGVFHRAEKPLYIPMRQIAQLGHHGAVNATYPGSVSRPAKQRSGVGEADEQLGVAEQRVCVQEIEDAHEPVAAAGEQYGAYIGIAQILVQLVSAPSVIAGQIALAGQHAGIDANSIARFEPFESFFEAHLWDWTGGGTDSYGITHSYCWR